jgi:cysteinyl-tRNA synthetase
MTIQLYNSLSRKKEPFTPVEKEKITMYVCGMTVYSDVHIGHARTYLAFDVIRRYFEYKGFKVWYVQNITDVDDKIIQAANREGVDPLVYSEKYTEACLLDLDLLGIRRADEYPKASEMIADMIVMIQQILTRGYGYVADGDVYFSVDKFQEYGKLSGQRIEEMKTGARIEPGEKKQSPLDFALWKSAKPGEPFWDSPWGKGRPGWHIECSTMSSKYLGLPFDIHGGGMDLRFPHHENEIAQAEAATGKPFARYWMHIGLLTVESEKMSKSLGNIVNVRDLLKKWDAEVIRMFFAQAHYRNPPDFNEKALSDVQKGLDRIHRLKEILEALSMDAPAINASSHSDEEQQYKATVDGFRKVFEDAMDDDFNTPQAFASIFEFVNTSNRFLKNTKITNSGVFRYALETLQEVGLVLTLFQPKYKKDVSEKDVVRLLQKLLQQYGTSSTSESVDILMQEALQIRDHARNEKQWKTADAIRDDLQQLGFEIQDTDKGPQWRRK